MLETTALQNTTQPRRLTSKPQFTGWRIESRVAPTAVYEISMSEVSDPARTHLPPRGVRTTPTAELASNWRIEERKLEAGGLN